MREKKVNILKMSYVEIRKKLRKLRLEKLRKDILHYYKDNKKEEFCKIVKYLEKNKIRCYNYEYVHAYQNMDVDVHYDKERELWYVMYKNKKMYMKKGWTKEQVQEYYRFLMIEQDEESPHLYFTKEFQGKKYRKVIDLGCAEGNFSLDIIDDCEKIYMFECDPGWIEALRATFDPWKEKVEIVPLFVSNVIKDNAVTLDDYFKNNYKHIDLIKIDIEGEEIHALEGAKILLKKNSQVNLLICAYHYQNEEIDIRKCLKGWNIKCREGYIVMIDDKKQRKPYLRHGILEACRELR